MGRDDNRFVPNRYHPPIHMPIKKVVLMKESMPICGCNFVPIPMPIRVAGTLAFSVSEKNATHVLNYESMTIHEIDK